MKPLRRLLDKVEPLFIKGGRLENFHAIYEMVDTLFFSPPDLTRGAPHVRDAINLKRVMGLVVIGVLPCALVGMWNTGHQANLAIAELIEAARHTGAAVHLLHLSSSDAVPMLRSARRPTRSKPRSSRSMVLPMVLLPQPDSPTRPRV